MQEILLRELNGIGVDYTTRVTESMLARVHFIVRTDPANPPGDDRRRRARRAARRRDPAVGRRLPPGAGAQARRRAGQGAVRRGTPTRSRRATRTSTRRTRRCKDLAKLELLEEPGQLEMHLFRKRQRRRRRAVQGLPVRRADDALGRAAGAALARRAGRPTSGRTRSAAPTAPSTSTTSACSCPPAHRELRRGARRRWRTRSRPPGGARPRSTASTSWCCAAGLTWRQVVVLRAYAKYLRQAGTVFSQEYMESTLHRLPGDRRAAGGAVRDPVRPAAAAGRRGPRSCRPRSWSTAISRQLDDVASLDQDRILRSYLTLIQATLRTASSSAAPTGGPSRTWRSSSTRRRSRTCRRPGRSTRSSSTRPGSRACTCASARSPAAACAGRTGARTSAPRCSAWSRRRW